MKGFIDLMKKIALIHDLSGFGRCSLTAAIPVISALGIQACPLPTAILSAQTGFDSYFYDDYTAKMNPITDEWGKMGEHFDGIYSGFLGNAAQMGNVLYFLDRFQTADNLYVADPVMGDHGKRFPIFTDKLLEAMRSLTARADVITPNLTELCLLTDTDYDALTAHSSEADYFHYIEEAARPLLAKADRKQSIIITGVISTDTEKSMIANLAISDDDCCFVQSPYTGKGFSGTGDLFTSCVTGCLVRGMSLKQALEQAIAFLQPAIEKSTAELTSGNHGVCFEDYLYLLHK